MEYLGRIIWQMQRNGQMFLDRALKPYRLGAGQANMLFMLFQREGISQEEISRRLHIDKAATAKTVQRLLREGYVERTRDDNDRRTYHISVTDKGRALENAVADIRSEWEAILLKGFDDAEAEQARTLLNRMLENSMTIVREEKP